MEASEGPTTGISTEESTEEAALLTGGGQEVSGLDSISHEEEDNLLSGTLQETMGETLIKGGSPVESELSLQSELMGGPPIGGADHPAGLPVMAEASEGTMTLTLTLEHQAEVHSSTLNAGADAKALPTAHGHPFIKPEPLDPKPVTFTRDLGVIDDELEIVDFMPGHEVSHASRTVKEEPLEGTSWPHRVKPSMSDSLPMAGTQHWSDAPNPKVGPIQSTLSDQPATLHPPLGSDQPSTSGAVLPPTVTSAGATLTTSIPSQGITATVTSQGASRSTTPMPSAGMGPISVHLFQLSTIDPPVDGPILYVCTQLAGSTRALQPPPSFKTPQGGIIGVDLEVSITGEFTSSPLNIHPIPQHALTASPASHHSGGKMHQMVRDVIHELKVAGLGTHLLAMFCEAIPTPGTIPLCKEDRIPVDPDADHMSCYYPESMVVMPRGKVFIRGLHDLIKDQPEWNINRLICVCMSRLHHHHGDMGIVAVLTDLLSYSSGALDNLVNHMYPQGAKLLQEIIPPGTQPVEHISTLVQTSDREVDLVEPMDAQHHCNMSAEHRLSFKGVTTQFTQLQMYMDFLDPSQMPPATCLAPLLLGCRP